MCACDRRTFINLTGWGITGLVSCPPSASALGEREQFFIAEALRMKNEAVAAGDQPFGAVVVRAGEIVGYGPSRVITDRNPDAHAERVALRDAVRRLRTNDVAGAVIYSTSRPCAACENALALGNIDRMFFGSAGIDAGRPRRQ